MDIAQLYPVQRAVSKGFGKPFSSDGAKFCGGGFLNRIGGVFLRSVQCRAGKGAGNTAQIGTDPASDTGLSVLAAYGGSGSSAYSRTDRFPMGGYSLMGSYATGNP